MSESINNFFFFNAIVKMEKEITNVAYSFYFSDFSKVFKFRFVHLGGDEVDTSKFNDLICHIIGYSCSY